MTEDGFKELITEKTKLSFDSKDGFEKTGPAQFTRIQLDAEINLEEEPRPIGEILTMLDVNSVEDNIVVQSNGSLKSAEDVTKVLAGAQLNDDDDQ